MRQNAVVLDYNENKIVFSKKGLHAPLVSHMPARTEQKLASAVMTYFEDRVCRNENHLAVGNLALISMPEKQWKVGDLDVNEELSVCQRDKLRAGYLSGNPLKDSNEVKTVEEEMELAVYRISAETLIERQRDDEFCRHTVEALRKNGGRYRNFLVRNEVLYKRIGWLGYRKEVIVLPRCMLDDVLKEMHDEPWTGGHFGLTKTLAKLRERYFVKNAEKEVEKYIASCRVCLERKKVSNQASLQPIVVQGFLEKIGIDVVGPIRRRVLAEPLRLSGGRHLLAAPQAFGTSTNSNL
ncbi:Retrovirus-related Pol polyprotein from transposon 412 [Eumeta japonica]|uniref:Retrovirus-related Pol polyprotein from transposon 412 n=1 Tax=Eumeta variegata TaxID=151549 RepID=A0A4C1YAQ3_EUMVA|nr:Retrovirus-related Pol polyprotein from transposon 412 [Eumeta japonica]